jgi:hypothetical protein
LCQRQLDATDAQIDALVASRELYDLSEEEIIIAEWKEKWPRPKRSLVVFDFQALQGIIVNEYEGGRT